MSVLKREAQRLRIGYTRCSSKKQDIEDKAFGRPVQMRSIVAWAAIRGLEIDRWIPDTCSGATLDREGLSEIRSLMSQGRVAQVFFARQDRLARDAHLAEALYREADLHDVELVNVQCQFEDNVYGTMLRRMLDNFAEIDRHQIVERTNRGRIEAIKKHGTHIYGFRVMGYRLLPSDECERNGLPHGWLEIKEDEAKIVRLVFDLREKGYSYGAIARWLNEHAYVTKTGSRFESNTVATIIQNEGFYRAERVAVSAQVLGLEPDEYQSLKPAHKAILPPRQAAMPLLTERMRFAPLQDRPIPDDPDEPPLPARSKIKTFYSLPHHYGAAILRAVELREMGTSYRKTAKILNSEGHKTRFGRTFRDQSVIDLERQLEILLPLAKESIERPMLAATELDVNDWDAPTRLAHSLARNGLSRKRGGVSLSSVAATLNAEFGSTPNGGRFHAQTVQRLLERNPPRAEQVKTVAYVRFTTDGFDHHGQVDCIEDWCQTNGLEISEWYVEKAAAYKRADNPELQRLLSDCSSGSIGRVAVVSVDRICTDYEVASTMIRKLSHWSEVVLIRELAKHLAPKRRKLQTRLETSSASR